MPVSVACSKVIDVLPFDALRLPKALSLMFKTLSGAVSPIPTLPDESIVILVFVPIAVVPILNLSLSPSSTPIVNV